MRGCQRTSLREVLEVLLEVLEVVLEVLEMVVEGARSMQHAIISLLTIIVFDCRPA